MYNTVCQFQDQMMVVCECHAEGMMLSCDKSSKQLYIDLWSVMTNTKIFSYNLIDAFRYLFTGNDVTSRTIDINREAVYQIACYINDVFKFNKKITKEIQSKEKRSEKFFVFGQNAEKLYISSDEFSCSFNFQQHDTRQTKMKKFWQIFKKGTTGINGICIDKVEAEIFLNCLIESLYYSW